MRPEGRTMPDTVKKIALITNFNIREKALAAQKTAQFLSSYPCALYASALMRQRIEEYPSLASSLTFVPNSTLYRDMDFIIVLGGDGSILGAARYCISSGIPILGINLGRLGYMAEVETDELPELEKLFDGRFSVEERSMIDVSVLKKGKQMIFRASALNDAVISGGSAAKMVDLELSASGRNIGSYHADGLIFSTPTGSTAYSMSAGGPVIDPKMKCICVTPICSHSLTAKPIVFSEDTVLEAKNICEREKRLFLTLDGKVGFEIYRGDTVKIRESEAKTRLVRLKEQSFCNTLRTKMNVNL